MSEGSVSQSVAYSLISSHIVKIAIVVFILANTFIIRSQVVHGVGGVTVGREWSIIHSYRRGSGDPCLGLDCVHTTVRECKGKSCIDDYGHGRPQKVEWGHNTIFMLQNGTLYMFDDVIKCLKPGSLIVSEVPLAGRGCSSCTIKSDMDANSAHNSCFHGLIEYGRGLTFECFDCQPSDADGFRAPPDCTYEYDFLIESVVCVSVLGSLLGDLVGTWHGIVLSVILDTPSMALGITFDVGEFSIYTTLLGFILNTTRWALTRVWDVRLGFWDLCSVIFITLINKSFRSSQPFITNPKLVHEVLVDQDHYICSVLSLSLSIFFSLSAWLCVAYVSVSVLLDPDSFKTRIQFFLGALTSLMMGTGIYLMYLSQVGFPVLRLLTCVCMVIALGLCVFRNLKMDQFECDVPK